MQDTAATTEDIVAFRFELAEGDISDLRRRLAATRWPEPETTGDWSQGVRLAWLSELAEYWRTEYDWSLFQQRLNRFPQFRTTIDGLGIHFLYVRSPHAGAVPLLLTHGWPGSIVEFQDVIEPLVDPTVDGGSPSQAFHVVCPSLPGYGFSDRPSAPGWNKERTADAWVELMARLGYGEFFAQGGDWGSIVTTTVAQRHPARLLGLHLNHAIVTPDPATADEPTEFERQSIADAAEFMKSGRGYSEIQSTRPQTLGYGLTDSPVAQLAWITDKYWAWCDHNGDPLDALTREQMLNNISLYWFTRTGVSSARSYWESAQETVDTGIYRQSRLVTPPSAITIFPREIIRPSRRWCEKFYLDLRFYELVSRGGHFAASEQPSIFIEQVRRAFATMR